MNDLVKNSVLIVDDDTSDLIFLTEHLSQDYKIYTAKDGEDGIKKAVGLRPDLVLLDIIMPGMSGYDVAEYMKRTEETKNIPIIFITGLDSKEDEERGLTMDAADYISKPFSSKVTKLRIRHQMQIINQLHSIELLNHNLEKTIMERTWELQEQTKTAESASRAKSVFLATMSHEFKTPLNAIIGMAGIARNSISNTGTNDPQREKAVNSINQIIASSHHLLSILNDVLDMSKIDSGKLELRSEPFSTLRAYNEFAGMIEHNCLAKKIRFTTNTDEMKDIIIVGDMLRLNQVLANLLGNAIKFTPEGGEISLLVHVLQESSTHIKYCFTVSDTGIGMTGEQMARLFKPFEQTDSDVSAKYGGIGLGLTISQNIVKMMGSRIHVESKIGSGSKFYFDLVFDKGKDEPKTEAEQTKHSYTGKGLSNKRILLADDIEINRMIIFEMLSAAGILLDEAENGRQAVEMFAASSSGYYDLVFMDLQMPMMNGYEAAEKIRSLDRPDSKAVPIIALTANSFKEDIDKALASGMNDHLPKPIDVKIVMDTLEKYIDTRSRTAEETLENIENIPDDSLSVNARPRELVD